MSRARWRLIDDGSCPGALNMALDVALLHAVERGASEPTVRFYGWEPPCLSLGRHQSAAVADLAFCRGEGIDVVRRPTGGRAVLHHLELTYSVVAPADGRMLPRGVQGAYRRIAQGLVDGLVGLGVDAVLADDSANTMLPRPTSSVPCFTVPAGGEIVVGGRKLAGSAVRVAGGVVLQHGSILVGWDGRLQAGALGLPDDSALRPYVTTLEAELGTVPDSSTLRAALTRGLEGALGVELVRGRFTGSEREEAARIRETFIARDEGGPQRGDS